MENTLHLVAGPHLSITESGQTMTIEAQPEPSALDTLKAFLDLPLPPGSTQSVRVSVGKNSSIGYVASVAWAERTDHEQQRERSIEPIRGYDTPEDAIEAAIACFKQRMGL